MAGWAGASWSPSFSNAVTSGHLLAMRQVLLDVWAAEHDFHRHVQTRSEPEDSPRMFSRL